MIDESDSSSLRLDNGTLALSFDVDEVGCALTEIRHVAEDATFGIHPDGPRADAPFWRAEFRNAAGYECQVESTAAGEFSYEVHDVANGSDATSDAGTDDDAGGREPTGDVVSLRWRDIPVRFPGAGTVGHASVEVRVELPESGRLAAWNASVTLPDEGATLWRFRFPHCGDLHRVDGDRRDDRLVVPDGWGAYVEHPTDADRLRTWNAETYPNGSMTMQFVALDNDGVGCYLGTHDPLGRPKEMPIAAPGDGLEYAVDHYPEDMGEPQSTFDLGFDFVTGVYEGDWYDAAQIYRDWALREAAWTEPGALDERSDVPDWFRDVVLWWAPGFDQVVPITDTEQAIDEADLEASVDLLSRLRERFPVPTAAHWYNWHRIPFDTDYPDYFPARAGFADAVEALQDDLGVMPYTNGRLADANSDGWEEYDLAEATATNASARLRPSARVDRTEEYGNGQCVTPMCAATENWQDAVEDFVRRLGEDVGVRGVYLDQIGAAAPLPCFSPDHDHPRGGGAYGVEAYRTLLDRLNAWKREADLPLALTTECNAEPFLGGFSGHLLWHSARSDLVPLYPTVYGDYAIAFGRYVSPDDLDRDGGSSDDGQAIAETSAGSPGGSVFAAKLAQVFDCGGQLGWFSEPVGERLLDPANTADADYLLETARALDAAREYVVEGRRLRDPEPESPLPTVEQEWNTHYTGRWDVELPVVFASVWRTPARDGAVLAVTNWTDAEWSPTWKLDAGELLGSAWSVVELAPDGTSSSHDDDDRRAGEDGAPRIETSLPPRSTRVFRLDPDT